MFDTSKLRGRIVEKYGSQKAFAQTLGHTSAHVSEVLSGNAYLGQKDIARWANALDITDDHIHEYFFALKVCE